MSTKASKFSSLYQDNYHENLRWEKVKFNLVDRNLCTAMYIADYSNSHVERLNESQSTKRLIKVRCAEIVATNGDKMADD